MSASPPSALSLIHIYLTEVRRHLLAKLPRLPIAGEYIHRTAFDIGEKYGKDTFLVRCV